MTKSFLDTQQLKRWGTTPGNENIHAHVTHPSFVDTTKALFLLTLAGEERKYQRFYYKRTASKQKEKVVVSR